jgi:hypothetical protein
MSTIWMVVGKKSNLEVWAPKRGKEMKNAEIVKIKKSFQVFLSAYAEDHACVRKRWTLRRAGTAYGRG